jgi:hypothetical protein
MLSNCALFACEWTLPHRHCIRPPTHPLPCLYLPTPYDQIYLVLLPNTPPFLFIPVLNFYFPLRVSFCSGLSFDLPKRGFLNLAGVVFGLTC